MSNNCGVDDWGLGVLLAAQRIRKMTSSYVGENKEFERQFLSGELELELTPQGTLAEKLRAGGSGIAGFFTQTGVGTQVAEGGLPRRYNPDGTIAVRLAGEGRAQFRGERGAEGLRARGGDHHRFLAGARRPRRSPRQSRVQQGGAQLQSARRDGRSHLHRQVEQLVEPGELDPDSIHLPGVFVHRIVEVGTDIPKRIERRTVAAEGA